MQLERSRGSSALLVRGLATLEASFHPDDRSTAIGAWSGFGGVAVAIGPFLGGWLIEAVSWRLIFLINIPLAVFVVWVALRHVPESRATRAVAGLDLPGTALGALGLAGTIFALTEGNGWAGRRPPCSPRASVECSPWAAMTVVEARSTHPMLPLFLFQSRQFVARQPGDVHRLRRSGGFDLSASVVLQEVVGLSPLQSGAALAPITILMLILSAGRAACRGAIGPRIP